MSRSPIIDKPLADYLLQKNTPLSMEYMTSGTTITELPMCAVPEFALVGRSNVGKSSLLNFMAGQHSLARVSKTPGRTQLIHLFRAEKERFIIADLPGYGYAATPLEKQQNWQKSLSYYFEVRSNLKAILFLIDARREINDEDRALAHWFQSLQLNIIGILTKCDKINKSSRETRALYLSTNLGIPRSRVVLSSADKKIGLVQIYSVMASTLGEK